MIKFYTEYAAKWEKALSSSGILEKELEVNEYENAILLPLRQRKDSPVAATDGYHEGGVCTEDHTFLAGLDRKWPRKESNFGCIRAYIPETTKYRDETVIFGGVIINLFGHTLVDSLGRMWYFAKNPDTPYKFVFLMMSGQEGFCKDFFHLAGLTEDRYEIITEPTQFKKVIIPEQAMYSLSHTAHKDWLLFFDKIKETVRKNYKKPTFDKVYLTRTQLPQDTLFEVNEEFFEAFYRKQGYTIVAPEKLPLAEQVNILMHATSVVTTMGTLSHAAVFTEGNADCTFLMRTPSEVIRPQLIIDMLKGYPSAYVQATKEILPSPHSRGVPLYFPTEYFLQHLADKAISYDPADVQMEISQVLETYIWKYMRNYREPENYRRIANHTAFDFINAMSYALCGEHLDKKKYQKPKIVVENEELRKENPSIVVQNEKLKEENQKLKKELAKSKKEIEKIKKSTSWKITKPIRL